MRYVLSQELRDRNSDDNRHEVMGSIQSCRNEEKSGDAEESTVSLYETGHVVTKSDLRLAEQ